VFVERLWRSVKYEEVYLRAYDSASDHRGHADDSGRQAQHFSIRALFVFGADTASSRRLNKQSSQLEWNRKVECEADSHQKSDGDEVGHDDDIGLAHYF
jgi:hypothetical protein